MSDPNDKNKKGLAPSPISIIAIAAAILASILIFSLNWPEITKNINAGKATSKPASSVDESEYDDENEGDVEEDDDDDSIIGFAEDDPYPLSDLFGGVGNDALVSTIALSDGGYAAAGYYESSMGSGDLIEFPLRSNNASIHGCVVRYDKSGKIMWVSEVSGTDYLESAETAVDDESYYTRFQDIIETDDELIVVGYSNELGSGDLTELNYFGEDDSILVAMDKSTGKVKWKKSYGTDESDAFKVIKKDESGYVAGGINKGTPAVLKLDKSGKVVWNISLADIDETVNDIAVMSDYYAVCAGKYLYTLSTDGKMLEKKRMPFNIMGLCQWGNKFVATGYTDSVVYTDEYSAFIPDGADASLYTAKGDTDAVIAVYDKNAAVLDFRFFGGEAVDVLYKVMPTNDGKGLIAVGTSEKASFGNGNYSGKSAVSDGKDAVIVRFDASLTPTDIKTFGNSSGCETMFIDIASMGNAYLTVGLNDLITETGNYAFDVYGATDSLIMVFDDKMTIK